MQSKAIQPLAIQAKNRISWLRSGDFRVDCTNCNKDAGMSLVFLQAISVPDDRYESYCSASDFIREHIFPGGHLPSLGAMQASAKGTGLTLSNVCDIGPHYAITLRQWRKAWERRRGEVEALGYSESFWRKYRSAFTSSSSSINHKIEVQLCC